ncbi:MAG: lysophospholipase [Mycoplasma sp.]|nr:lysophospholipase [Candidatus Hennigella equi]
MTEKFINSFDGKRIYCYLWDDVDKPIGIVQIFHGMAEHAKRYEELAKELNKAGYIVFADDHRGHGKTPENGKKLGTYEGKDIFIDTLKDEIFFSKMLKHKYSLPLYVLGHSYGSFLAQEYITKYDDYEKVIICGSALMKGRLDVKFGLFLAWFLKLAASKKEAKLIEKINYSNYNKMVKEGSWLNTDTKEVEKYYADDFNGKPLSNKFYFNMFNGFRHMYRRSAIKRIPKDKPIFLIAGENDPVGSMSKSVKALHDFYKKNNIKNVEMKIYKNARHEILNEPKIKQEVYKDIINFLKK